MSNRIPIDIALQPKQRELFERYDQGPETIFGYGGSRGGAKSHGARAVMILRRMKYANTPGYLIRKTLDDLRDNHIRPMLREYPILEPYYKKQEKVIEFPNGSYIRFISSDNYDDIFKFIGKEAADVIVDQSEQFTQEQIEFLETINRCTTNLDITPKMLLTFNPGDAGHQYHKRIFLDKQYESYERPEEYAFIRAYGWDNVEWVRKALIQDRLTVAEYYSWDSDRRFQYFITRSDYGRNLDAKPESQRKAQLLGDFDVFEGQFFSMWRRDLHIIDPMSPPDGAEVVAGLDYGERTVLEVQFMDHEGTIVNFLECYTEAMSPAERANEIADVLINAGLKKLRMYYDTNMDIDLKNYYGTDKTPAQIFRDVFKLKMGENAPQMIKVSKASTDKKGYRAVTNEVMRELLDWRKNKQGEYEKRPHFFVTRNCQHLRVTMPVFQSDKESVEGLDFIRGQTIEDPFDAAKYCTMAIRKPLKKGPPAVPPRDRDLVESEDTEDIRARF